MKVHGAFVEVKNIKRSAVDPPFTAEVTKNLAYKIDSAAETYCKRVSRPFIVVSMY